ncbi:MAG: hypothetical protein IJU79_05480 [Desulfovibrionaceae bacterium]|nr:hypothetical protein [Desulfovibrionaceae bacterium]
MDNCYQQEEPRKAETFFIQAAFTLKAKLCTNRIIRNLHGDAQIPKQKKPARKQAKKLEVHIVI